MKYYQLAKDLPTFEKGEIFYIDINGSLMSNKEPHVMAYAKSTLEKFPNILGEWFREVPARTDTRWFHNFIYKNPRAEIRFIKGRLKFGGSKNSAPFPSMVVVFRPQ